MSPKEKEDLIVKNILKNFDFEKCVIAMRALNWTWGFDNRIVTVPMLKEKAEYVIRTSMETVKKKEYLPSTYASISTGGLLAKSWKNKYNRITASKLYFIVCDWDDDGDE
jgi:hypothetical protein